MKPPPRRAATVVAIVLATILSTPLAQGKGRHDELRLAIKQELFARINRDRAEAGLPAVRFDPHASAIGDDFCQKQIKDRTTGHVTLDGLAPYMRYAFAGGNDGVSENAAAWSANYRFSEAMIPDLARRCHEAMIAEKPPHDGHRRTILDPSATHVGIGLAWQQGEFRMVQEFVRRYIFWDGSLPRTASPSDRLHLRGRPLDGYTVESISVHYEPHPEPIARVTANRLDSYSLPSRRRDYLPRLETIYQQDARGVILARSAEYSDGSKGDFPIDRDGGFAFSLPFSDGPGIYTVVTWIRKGGSEEPIAASNISIRVGDRGRSQSLVSGSR